MFKVDQANDASITVGTAQVMSWRKLIQSQDSKAATGEVVKCGTTHTTGTQNYAIVAGISHSVK